MESPWKSEIHDSVTGLFLSVSFSDNAHARYSQPFPLVSFAPGPWLPSATFVFCFSLSLSLFPLFFLSTTFLTRQIFSDKFRSPKLPEKVGLNLLLQENGIRLVNQLE